MFSLNIEEKKTNISGKIAEKSMTKK